METVIDMEMRDRFQPLQLQNVDDNIPDPPEISRTTRFVLGAALFGAGTAAMARGYFDNASLWWGLSNVGMVGGMSFLRLRVPSLERVRSLASVVLFAGALGVLSGTAHDYYHGDFNLGGFINTAGMFVSTVILRVNVE